MDMTQTSLFSWDAVEARSDLDRLKLVHAHLPDERLVQYPEVMRGQGRDDYLVLAGAADRGDRLDPVAHANADRSGQGTRGWRLPVISY